MRIILLFCSGIWKISKANFCKPLDEFIVLLNTFDFSFLPLLFKNKRNPKDLDFADFSRFNAQKGKIVLMGIDTIVQLLNHIQCAGKSFVSASGIKMGRGEGFVQFHVNENK